MQKNKDQKKGLALGAILALVASSFAFLAPAKANEQAVVAYPAVGLASETTMLITEQFDLQLRFGTGVDAGYRDYDNSPAAIGAAGFGITITKPAGTTISVAVNGGTAAKTTGADITATSVEYSVPSSGSGLVEISVSDKTSVSAAVALTVTPFLDLDRDGVKDAGEPVGDAVVLNFVPWSAVGAVVTLGDPVGGDRGATASVTVNNGTLNWLMLDADFALKVVSTNDGTTFSQPISGTNMSGTSVSTSGTTDAGDYSASYTVATAPFTTSGVVQSVSAQLIYSSASFTAAVVKAVSAVSANGVTISPVTGANAKLIGANDADVRFNSAFTVRAYAHSASATTSLALATKITVSAVSQMEFDADSGVILDGTTYTSAAAVLAAGFTLASGDTTFAMSTFGQTNDSGDDYITVTIKSQLLSADLKLTLEAATYTPVYVPTQVAGLAGAAKTFALEVKDNFGQLPARTDMRIKSTVALGGSTSDAVYSNVVAGKATAVVTPTPSTRTGSATVTFLLQTFNQETQAWVDGNSDTATWNVYTYAAGSETITSRTASISASISYGVDLSWSATAIAVGVSNSFSDVIVSAPGLMIQNADSTTETASDAITVAANGQTANFKFTSRLAGTYTVTFTNGTATTTSQVVVNPAADSDGSVITFDTTAIAAGSTAVITGTLKDANGNPVNTSGSATILVTYAPSGNAGIPIGTMPTETDADGNFTVTVLTGANDKGTAVITAKYSNLGAATTTANVKTFAQTIVVGGAAASTADQKVNAGSFKGYVAVYAKGYEGQRLSAKVGNDWVVVPALASNFVRVVEFTGAGYTIAVRIYIDRVLVDTITVTTK